MIVQPTPLDELVIWCHEHSYLLLVSYHESVRFLTPVSVFRKTGGIRMSAFDSTHPDEEHPRYFKLEELILIGITRVRPMAVALKKE